jgi:hypothetical protein
MIEPLNKITCDWCGKFELITANTVPKEYFLLSIRNAPTEKEEKYSLETPDVEKALICTACVNSIQSVKNLRMKERSQNKRSQISNLKWAITVEQSCSGGDRALP